MKKKNIPFLFILFILLSAQMLTAQTNVSGEVSGTWELINSPYIVVGDLSIVGDSLLVMEAGVEVKFDGFYQFVVWGILSAVGTELSPILFTSNAATPSPGDWYNIELSDSSLIQYCIVEYAGQPEPYSNRFAIRLNGDCEIKYNIIRHNAVTGIGAMFDSSVIKNNLIHDNSSAFFASSGIYSQWSSAKIENNTIVNNSGAGLWLQANSDSLTVINNIIANNSGVGFQYDQIAGSPFPITDYNDVWENTPNYSGFTPGAHSISDDPLFVGAGDYSLTVDSPCIDAGDPTFPLDPDGTISDMGTFYYHQDQGIVVEDIFPDPGEVTISEGDVIVFYITAYDPDGEALEYSWQLDNEVLSTISSFEFVTNNNSAGEYELILEVTDNFGNRGNRNSLSFNWTVIVEDVSSAPEEILPTVTAIYQNVPNPFNPTTTIRFDLSKTADVRLEIYNTKGQKVTTLVNQQLDRGNHTYIWNGKEDDGSPVASGVYFYKLRAGDFEQVRKMMILK